ncbi:MAG: isoprenyl transferase [Acidobacteria bacterium]|nr:isoprenyl transferase [Acidobacteriota bacterium]
MLKDFEGIVKQGSHDERLLLQIDQEKLPRHVAVIMDGNGRWAARRRRPRAAGHRAGAESVRAVVETSARLGIPVLTLYAFSTENWKRPDAEVQALMALLREYMRRELIAIKKNNIRFRVIGRIEELDPDIQRGLHEGMLETAENTGMQLNIGLNYSGRAELIDAIRSIAGAVRRGEVGPGEIDEPMLDRHLYTAGLPDPDLLIRTSGEMRLSNFMLWQVAYSEIYVTDTFWPDFRRTDFLTAILEYQRRERRYGGVLEPTVSGAGPILTRKLGLI